MKHRALALLGLIATLTVVGLLLHERVRVEAPAAALAMPSAPAEVEPSVELAVAEPEGMSEGRVEARPKESEPPVLLSEETETMAERPLGLDLPKAETTDTVLVFRALDEEGQAVCGELSVSTKIRSRRNAGSSGTRVSTNAEGRFEARIEPSLGEDEHRVLEICAEERALMAHVDLSRSFPPGPIDMGDLVLTPAPTIVEGRVLDSAGNPVAEATILAQTLPSQDGVWEPELDSYFGAGQSAADGAFAMYGSTNAARIEVCCTHEVLRALPLVLPVGSRGIEIVAQASGGVAGSVLVDPGVPVETLWMTLSPENVAPGLHMDSFSSLIRSSQNKRTLTGDGGFEIEGLLPWLYTFSLAAGDVRIEIHSVEVVSGEITRDPRLQALDLRGRLHVFTLELVRPSPSLTLSGSVCYSASGTSTPVYRAYFDRSPLVIVTPLAAIDVMVRARECRIERLSDLAERTEVRLRPGLSVRLALPRDVALPAPPLFVSAELVRMDQRREERPRSYAEYLPAPPFDENGETVCLAAEPGRWTIRWFLEHRNRGRGGSREHLDMQFEQAVVVEDREGEQRIELAVTQQALDSALAAR